MTRQAICTCGSVTPSTPTLGFFMARPALPYDLYYCGHHCDADWDGTPSDENCPDCSGAGVVSVVETYDSGEHAFEARCATCNGSGVRA